MAAGVAVGAGGGAGEGAGGEVVARSVTEPARRCQRL